MQWVPQIDVKDRRWTIWLRPYDGRWSKTMIGYGSEDDHFVIEVTYNYGIGSYVLGNDYYVGWVDALVSYVLLIVGNIYRIRRSASERSPVRQRRRKRDCAGY